MTEVYNQKKILGLTVAKQMAQLAYASHLAKRDGTVGPDCFAIWRNSKRSRYKGGGAHQFFSRGQPTQGPVIPSIANGMDISAITQVIMEEMAPYWPKVHEAWENGEEAPEFDGRDNQINQRLGQLHSTPDEKLR